MCNGHAGFQRVPESYQLCRHYNDTNFRMSELDRRIIFPLLCAKRMNQCCNNNIQHRAQYYNNAGDVHETIVSKTI